LALLGDESGDAMAFLGEVDRIGLFVDNFIEVVAKTFSPIPSAFYEDVLIEWR